MAFFSAAIAAITSSLASTFALGAFGTAVLKTVVGIGLNLLAAKLSGAGKQDDSFGVKGQLQRGADVPQSIVFGKTATAGSLAYANTWGIAGKTPNAFLTMVISLSDMPLQSLDSVWVNGERGTIAPIPHATYGHPIEEYFRDGSDYVWVKFYDGTQTTADSMLANDVSTVDRPWAADAIGTGTAYAVVTVKVNRDLFSGFPSFLFEVTGMPLYDPSKDTTVGGDGAQRWADPATWGGDGDSLPAVQIYNLMRGLRYGSLWVYGMQVTSEAQLPAAHWIGQINKCRATIAANDGPEPLYRAGGEISIDAPVTDAVRALLDACQGRLTEAGGIYKLFVGEPDADIATFSDDDIISTDEQSFTPFFGLADTINGISAKFPDPAQAWQVETAPPLFRTDLEADDGDRRLMADIDFNMVPYAEQVQRLMLSGLNEARRARRHTFTLPPRFWALEPGDVVEWTSTRNGYADKLFRVDGVLDQPNADIIVDLTEIDPSDYDFNTDVDFTAGAQGAITGSGVPAQSIGGWTATATTIRDGEGTELLPAILVGWDEDVDDVVAVRVQVRIAANDSMVFDGRIEDVALGEGVVSQAILASTAYEVRGKYVPGTPRETEWSAWLDVTTDNVGFGSDAFNNSIAEQIRQAIDTESAALVASFNATFDDITDEVARLDVADAALSTTFTAQIGAVTADLAMNYYTIAGTDSAIAAVQTLLESSIGSVSANLSANYYTRASTDSAIATAVNTLSTTVNGNTASITSLSASIDGVEATYGVRINNNGHISGFSLISQSVAGGAQSDFIIVDSSFRVVNTSGAGSYTPLAVYPTGRTVDGAFVPAGVHAQDLYVTRGNIANLAVDTLKIAGRSITAPYSTNGPGMTGNNTWISAGSIPMWLKGGEVCYVLLTWYFDQGYATYPGPTWGFRLKENGAVFRSREGMTLGTDYVSGVIQSSEFTVLPSSQNGNTRLFTYALEWKGSNSDISADPFFTAQAIYK